MSTDLLHIASSGVRAARVALDLTAQNIANAGTQGYIRRSLQLNEVASAGGYNRTGDLSFSGVRVDGIARNADAFRQAEVRRTGSDAARGATELSAYQNVEAALEHSGLYAAMAGFESALQQMTTDPVDPSLRAAALESSETLARTFNLASDALDTVAQSLHFAATDGVTQVNRLAGELGRVNLQLARSVPGTADHVSLLDQRDGLLGQISGYVGITTSFSANQTVEVRIGGSSGPHLVAGGAVSTLGTTAAADGTLSFTVGATAATLSAGSLAGQTQGLQCVRDSRNTLNVVAQNLIATVNGAQTSGVALDGSPGQPLLSGTGASDIAVVLASGSQLATAPAGAPAGSRDPANLAALRSALVSSDISGQIDALLFQISSATEGRRITSDALTTIAGASKLALDAQAGVNLDEEAVNLVRFQQAFQASSKAIQVASDLFDTLLAIR
ncbi:MAG: flagellar hook-associated protein FlgK [Sphingomonadales bacterium]|nr:flagellar hook-associated protein FlgK [Sphingomonadales bacterium]